MDFQRGLALFTLVALCLFGALNAQQDDGNTTQYGGLSCVKTGNLLDVMIYVHKNQSNITGVEFTKYDDFKVRYRSGDCVFTGDGSIANPFTSNVQIDLTTDLNPTGKTFCGHTLTAATTTNPKLYSWVVHTYQSINNDVFGDLYIRFTCAATDLPTNLSIQYNIKPAPTRQLSANHGIAKLKVVNTNNIIVTSVPIGSSLRLELEYTPSSFNASDGHDQTLRPWGIYCKSMYATPDVSSSRKIDMQTSNGCPLTGTGSFRPTASFTNTNAANKYISRTGDFIADRFDALVNEGILASSGTVFFVCMAEVCVRPDNTLCDTRCQPSGRRRREDEEDPEGKYESVSLVAILDLVDPSDGPDQVADKADSSIGVEYIVALAVGTAVVLFGTLACIIFICMRMHRREPKESYHRHSNPSSVTSTVTSYDGHGSRTASSVSKPPSKKHYIY